MDDYSKLSHVGPVKYEDFYSKLQGKINITPEEYENFKSEFYNKGCVTMKDWLKIYNLIDVIPFVEALEKTRKNYMKDEIDMIKDCVSIPGISMTYVINKAIKLKDRNDPELYAPGQPCTHKCEETCDKKVVRNVNKLKKIVKYVQRTKHMIY